MNDDFDDLDRALFALPLEEPPLGLRESILRATIYAPVATPAPFSAVETVGIGVALALAAWVAMICVADRTVVVGIAAFVVQILRAISDVQTIAWLGIGSLAAAGIWIGISTPFPSPFRRRTS